MVSVDVLSEVSGSSGKPCIRDIALWQPTLDPETSSLVANANDAARFREILRTDVQLQTMSQWQEGTW